MAHRIDHLKENLIGKVAALAAERLPPPLVGPAQRLIEAFYANVAAEDMAGREAEALYGAALGLFAAARDR